MTPSFRVIWSADDNEWVGLCAEFPSLSYLHPDKERALLGIFETVEAVLLDMKITEGE